ncbi:hypothetical protein KGM_209524 [Danaus plexippus plexippus]|uniref:Ribonucleases P/MRP subunit Pop8-like domain-containing protein n=1 Tax=Danaus plexippus plexippus TaxID=278856 RepID=A0A212FJG6_DANPL|nr:hypothetical protein KGM_209524 [Danaus plexippus plexippus]
MKLFFVPRDVRTVKVIVSLMYCGLRADTSDITARNVLNARSTVGIRAHSDRPKLLVQQQVQEAVKQLFGASGAGSVIDVLAVRAGRALLRVPRQQLRRLRAALALRPTVRVRAEAASLQALV